MTEIDEATPVGSAVQAVRSVSAEAKAKLLDAAPLCGLALDASGKAVAANKVCAACFPLP